MSPRSRLLRRQLLFVCAGCLCMPAMGQSTSTPPPLPAKDPNAQVQQDPQGSQPTTAATQNEAPSWRFTIAPYVWVPQVHGDLGAGGESSGVSLGLDDTFAFAYAVPAHLEASYRDLTLFSDVLYLKVKSDTEGSLASSEAEAYIAEVGGAWRLYDSAPSRRDPTETRWTIEPLLGVRYYGASVGVKIPSIGFDDSVREDWFDGMAGVRVGFSPSENWSFGVRGDVAAGSSFTWNVVGSVQWSISDWFALNGGYRVLDVDYRSGGSADEFEFNLQLRGPFLAAVFRF